MNSTKHFFSHKFCQRQMERDSIRFQKDETFIQSICSEVQGRGITKI